MRVLVVCSANRCRSPMAAALLAARLSERGLAAEVRSAGFGPTGQPVAPEATAAMAEVGLDLREHRSDQVSARACADADLIVGMTRQHVVDLALLDPASWPRIFPLTDLVRRGRHLGPRVPGELPDGWVGRVQGGRPRSSVLALPVADDVADPMGGPPAAFRRTRSQLDRLVVELAELLAPGVGHPAV